MGIDVLDEFLIRRYPFNTLRFGVVIEIDVHEMLPKHTTAVDVNFLTNLGIDIATFVPGDVHVTRSGVRIIYRALFQDTGEGDGEKGFVH